MSKQLGGSLAPRRSKRIYLQYTVLFVLMTLGVFAVLILSHRSFIQYGDGYKQGYFRIVELRNLIGDIRSGRGMHLWSWDKGTGLEYSLGFFVDPFNVLAALFPIRYLELGITVAALCRMYLAGFVFLLFGRRVDLTDVQALVGAVCYTFSGWLIEVSTKQNQFALNMVLFPLLVLGVERIYRKKSPLPFILMVAYYLMWSTYFAYMAAIVIVIYIVMRFPAYRAKDELSDDVENGAAKRSFWKTMGVFIGYGLLGIVLSGIVLFPSMLQMVSLSTESGQAATGALFDANYYLDMGARLLGRGHVYDYMDLGVPVLALALFPVAFRKISRRSTHLFMVLLLTVVYMIPVACRVMNGFSYPTTRWVFTLIFFLVWCAAEQLDAERLRLGGSGLLMLTGFAALVCLTIGLYFLKRIRFTRTDLLFMLTQLIAGALLIVLILLIRRSGKVKSGYVAAMLAITLTASSFGWSLGFRDNLADFNRNSSIYKRLQTSSFRVSKEIDDEGFYRIDAGMGIDHNNNIILPSNESVYWRINQTYIYNSRVPSKLLFLNKAVGNNRGYQMRVAVVTNDNRTGLDYLFGVRYYLGTDAHEEEYSHGDDFFEHYRVMDNLAGYGFEKAETVDGVSVYKSKYQSGLGFAYDKVLPESEFMLLTRLGREQALLQAAVVPDDELDKLEGIPVISAADVVTDIDDITYETEPTAGISVEGNRIIVSQPGESVTLRFESPADCQLMLSFDNLRKVSGGSHFSIRIENEFISRMIERENGMQSMPNVVDFDYNLGYYGADKQTTYVTLTFEDAGEYQFDRMYLSAMNTALFDRFLAEREENLYRVSAYDDATVTGLLDADKDGVVVLAIPANENWDLYIDGTKAERIDDIDLTFFGARVAAGSHTVTLRYHNRYLTAGAAVSAAGAVLTIIILIIRRLRIRKGESA